MNGSEVALAALAIMATIVGVLVWLLKKLFNQNDTTLKDGNKANMELAKSINRLSHASEEQLKSSHARDEAQRQFQEHVVEKLTSIDSKADRNFHAINNQTVKEQTVEHQTIQSSE